MVNDSGNLQKYQPRGACRHAGCEKEAGVALFPGVPASRRRIDWGEPGRRDAGAPRTKYGFDFEAGLVSKFAKPDD
jgi:hypothetical protein